MSRNAFSKSLAARERKTNNHPAAHSAKVDIRARVLAEIGAPKAHVFDAFAGDGQMFKAVWSKAAGYAGCDLEWYRDDRLAFVANNLRVLRAIDLAPFNVFDFDAWGSPWQQCEILALRRPVKPGERLGLVLTEGSGLKIRLGGLPEAMRSFAGLQPGVGSSRQLDDVIDRALAGLYRRMAVKPLKRWQAKGKTGATMRYIGLVVEGRS